MIEDEDRSTGYIGVPPPCCYTIERDNYYCLLSYCVDSEVDLYFYTYCCSNLYSDMLIYTSVRLNVGL